MSRKLGPAPLIGLTIAVLFTLTGCGHIGKTDATAASAATASAKAAAKTSSATAAPAAWRTIDYSKLPGVPTGYFGPKSPCLVKQDPKACIADLKEVTKHDGTILSVWLAEFNLLPGQGNLNPASKTYANQVESIRAAYAKKLKDWRLRQAQQPRLAAVLDSMRDVTVTRLSGSYYTTFEDPAGNVHQTTKVMNPKVNVSLNGTTPDGKQHRDKLDCGHQRVSKYPLPGVPTYPIPKVPTRSIPKVPTRSIPKVPTHSIPIVPTHSIPKVPTHPKAKICPPNMPHGVWPVCKDDPSRDPQAQGNVPTQVGGQNPPLISASPSPPAVTRPSPGSVYTPPAPPAPTTSPRPTPTPTPEPSTPPSTAPEPSPTINPCTVNPDWC